MLNPNDHKRVSFITSGKTYCYVVMAFGLKNAAATYQRLVDRMFGEQLRRNMEVYVDGMLVKSRQMDQHLADLAETFDTLRKYHIKLNPAKCAFGPRSAIKAQALAEFVNEATLIEEDEGSWLFHVDGSSTLIGSGAGVVLTSLEGDKLEYALRFNLKASHNETEYEALIVGIRMALNARAKNLIVHSDSQLVTDQVEGKYEAKEERMKEYLQEIDELTSRLKNF
ncbi:UNVERIFIED_CONTAM: hypothetical protein Slati_4219200 [Sesamum latifolium]|uniref:RNase H type-1 domain-containing protein n=1 Tax=Sesamum latifolium TaxID=2727402 RepID=A0AAW2TAR6_9LAMI